MAFDGGSILIFFCTPDDQSFSLELDRQIGSATPDRFYFRGDFPGNSRDLIDIDQEGPWLNQLRRIVSDSFIEDSFELGNVCTVLAVVEGRSES
jgi:hypothetical protein